MMTGRTIITVAKADPLVSDEVQAASLFIEQPIPKRELIGSFEAFYESQADLVMQALSQLPGGTFDRLLVRMLDRRRDILVGRYVPANRVSK